MVTIRLQKLIMLCYGQLMYSLESVSQFTF